MPQAKKLSALDEMRVIAWFKEVLAAADCKNALELTKISIDAEGTEREFRLYEKGGRLPSEDTLTMVDARFDSPISRTFLAGPDGCPLWEVLNGNPEACRQALDLWLSTEIDHRLVSDKTSRTFTSLKDKFSLACKLLGITDVKAIGGKPLFTYHFYAPPSDGSTVQSPAKPPEPIPAFSIDGYAPAFLGDEEKPTLPPDQERAAFVEMAVRQPDIADLRNFAGPFPRLEGAIGPDALAGVFALRTLALTRGEMLRETHYLVSTIRQSIPEAVDFWGISKRLLAYTADPTPATQS